MTRGTQTPPWIVPLVDAILHNNCAWWRLWPPLPRHYDGGSCGKSRAAADDTPSMPKGEPGRCRYRRQSRRPRRRWPHPSSDTARLAPGNATKLDRNERKRAEREPAADAARHAIAAKKAKQAAADAAATVEGGQMLPPGGF